MSHTVSASAPLDVRSSLTVSASGPPVCALAHSEALAERTGQQEVLPQAACDFHLSEIQLLIIHSECQT